MLENYVFVHLFFRADWSNCSLWLNTSHLVLIVFLILFRRRMSTSPLPKSVILLSWMGSLAGVLCLLAGAGGTGTSIQRCIIVALVSATLSIVLLVFNRGRKFCPRLDLAP